MNTKHPTTSNARISVKITEQIPESMMSKTVTKRSTGINILSLEEGERHPEGTSPFDTFIQIIDGSAEIIIEGISHFLKTGQIFILPAHITNTIKAITGFKMIHSSIKGVDE